LVPLARAGTEHIRVCKNHDASKPLSDSGPIISPLEGPPDCLRPQGTEFASCLPTICRLLLLYRSSLPQQSHRSPLIRAAKQQRISQGRALHDLTRPLVVSGKLHANREICTSFNQ
jgi:hypothetical protein